MSHAQPLSIYAAPAPADDVAASPAGALRILVVGVGGAGGNAVANMVREELAGIEFAVVNTDAQALRAAAPAEVLQIGAHTTRGLGAGAYPETGRAAAEESIDEIHALIDGTTMLFITAGMGGGTGTGAAPVIARAARERGILTVAVVTMPFELEGAARMRRALDGIDELRRTVDTLITIPNQNLFRIASEQTTLQRAFALADDVLTGGIRAITDLMLRPGLVNLDFADVRAVISEGGQATMGTGEGEGTRRARDAAEAAISNPLLEEAAIGTARGVLVNVVAGPDVTLFEIDAAVGHIRESVSPEANLIFGASCDEALAGRLRVAVVATGIGVHADAAPEVEQAPPVAEIPVQQKAAAVSDGAPRREPALLVSASLPQALAAPLSPAALPSVTWGLTQIVPAPSPRPPVPRHRPLVSRLARAFRLMVEDEDMQPQPEPAGPLAVRDRRSRALR